MATERQIAANRLNAQRSTGPRTEAGKANSRGNALKHGLTAEKMLLDYEDADAFNAFHEALEKEHAPLTFTDQLLVRQFATTFWRLRRAPGYEQTILLYKKHYLQKRQKDHPNRAIEHFNATRVVWQSEVRATIPEPDHIDPSHHGTALEWGRALLEAFAEGDLLSKLGRHEAHLERQLWRILDRLEKSKRERQAIPCPAPQQVVAPPEHKIVQGPAVTIRASSTPKFSDGIKLVRALKAAGIRTAHQAGAEPKKPQ